MFPFFNDMLFDERFKLHRLRASRFALGIAVLGIGVLAFRDLHLHHTIPIELLVLLAAVAAAKIGAMIYLRLTD